MIRPKFSVLVYTVDLLNYCFLTSSETLPSKGLEEVFRVDTWLIWIYGFFIYWTYWQVFNDFVLPWTFSFTKTILSSIYYSGIEQYLSFFIIVSLFELILLLLLTLNFTLSVSDSVSLDETAFISYFIGNSFYFYAVFDVEFYFIACFSGFSGSYVCDYFLPCLFDNYWLYISVSFSFFSSLFSSI